MKTSGEVVLAIFTWAIVIVSVVVIGVEIAARFTETVPLREVGRALVAVLTLLVLGDLAILGRTWLTSRVGRPRGLHARPRPWRRPRPNVRHRSR